MIHSLLPILLASLATFSIQAAEPFGVKVSGKPGAPPVLLIPGLSSSGEVWDDTVKHLGQRYECHVFTLAGFAGQPRMGDEPFLNTVKEAVVAYAKARKMRRPIVFGHSLGGHMALWMAAESPTLFGKLVIVDSLPHLGAMMFPDASKLGEQAAGMRAMITSQTKEQYAGFLKQGPMLRSLVNDSGYERVLRWSLESDPVAIGNAMYDLYTMDLREAVANVPSEALVLGSWVGYAPYSNKEQTAAVFAGQYAKMPRKEIVLSDTAKHFIMLDDPKWYLEQVDRFLGRADAK